MKVEQPPPTEVEIHYEALLADCYSWISGGFAARAEENRRFFARHGVSPRHSGRAVDLGAGPGFQSIPLAEAGFTVDAVDTSRKLLDELRGRKGALDITCHRRDALDFLQGRPEPVELVVCMGDTLSHFASRNYLARLFSAARARLAGEGRLVLGFRDLSARLEGVDRFIPVRSDADTVFTCFLEYLDDDRVRVHDLLYTRREGAWTLQKGAYDKLRLEPSWVTAALQELGFRVETPCVERGLVTVIAVQAAGRAPA